MSLNESLLNAINNVVNTYIERVAQKYDLDSDQLRNLWEGSTSSAEPRPKKGKTKTTEVSSVDTDDLSDERLIKCNKAELSALCKAQGVKCTGTKAVLIARLMGKDEDDAKTVKKSAKKSKAKSTDNSSKVVKKLTANVPTIPIRRNQFNNLEHPETGFVFDKKTQEVIGKQNDNGSLDTITPADIDLCKKFKFKYIVPENLDNKASLAEVQVEELDDSDDEEDEIVLDDDDDIEMVLGDDEDEDEDEDDMTEEEYYEEDD